MDLTTGSGSCVPWRLGRRVVLGLAGCSDLCNVCRGSALLTGGRDPSLQGWPAFLNVTASPRNGKIGHSQNTQRSRCSGRNVSGNLQAFPPAESAHYNKGEMFANSASSHVTRSFVHSFLPSAPIYQGSGMPWPLQPRCPGHSRDTPSPSRVSSLALLLSGFLPLW